MTVEHATTLSMKIAGVHATQCRQPVVAHWRGSVVLSAMKSSLNSESHPDRDLDSEYELRMRTGFALAQGFALRMSLLSY